ncbi:MAG: hypothetical protein JOY82_14910 [Streptosporangiaceae bacterium]|nr:hypothetical protein [Streptosporangiaceae bacterium]MBV9855781.1 hypothetical protein [Streptosporangiaceae bacterium]
MSIHRSFRPHRRTVAIAAVAAMAVAIAVAVTLSGAHAPHRLAQAADVSQASATALCSTSGPGGTWTISTAGIATLSPAGTGPAAPGPCTNISLPDAGQASAIQQCASALQAAQQQIQQESASVLFSEFMTNLIQNNAGRWASALTSQGYQGPAPSSQRVSDAINQVSATNSDLDNAVAQALASLLNHSFDTPVDCSAGAESVPNWYSNAFQALADDDTEAQLVNQALNAVAGQLQQWASLFTAPAPAGGRAA